MYQCSRCGGTFASFVTAGQCPLCGGWADVRCANCGHTDEANAFIAHGNRCPKCNAEVVLPGAADTRGSLSARDQAIGCGMLLLLTSCCMPLMMWDEIQRSGYVLLLVAFAAAAGAVVALAWGVKGRMRK